MNEIISNGHSDGHSNIAIAIFRYKFSDVIMTELHNFAKLHEFDHRTDFKDAWKIWVEDNTDSINKEILRLNQHGYPESKDVIDKMYKSTRYYFRKKSVVKVDAKKRRNYIRLSKRILGLIDDHLNNNINNPDFKPCSAFVDFYDKHKLIIEEETEEVSIEVKEIQNKMKKTYQNRYFVFVNK
uniref:Uncharacterized protein n=1 Tax=viral metagenome TaxID=1070528 RepID=A0A6C0LNF2_9ZZZZ